MNKKYIVRLTAEERQQLEALVSTGRTSAAKIKHAHVLLKADADGPGWSDTAIAAAFSCHPRTVEGIRQRCVLAGLDAALARRQSVRPSRTRLLDGAGEARLIALSCSSPPAGHSRWSLSLLADKLVELNIVATISYQTVRRTLKKIY